MNDSESDNTISILQKNAKAARKTHIRFSRGYGKKNEKVKDKIHNE